MPSGVRAAARPEHRQSATVALRGTSSLATAGTGNWILAAGEWIASAVATILSILLPVLGLLRVVLLALMLYGIWQRRRPLVTGKAPAV
jgi:hypothetical protein